MASSLVATVLISEVADHGRENENELLSRNSPKTSVCWFGRINTQSHTHWVCPWPPSGRGYVPVFTPSTERQKRKCVCVLFWTRNIKCSSSINIFLNDVNLAVRLARLLLQPGFVPTRKKPPAVSTFSVTKTTTTVGGKQKVAHSQSLFTAFLFPCQAQLEYI